MKKNKIVFLNSKLKQMVTQVPPEYKDELEKEFIDINVNRERILAYILIIIEILLLMLNIILKDIFNLKSRVGFTLCHCILLISPVVFLYFACAVRKSAGKNFKLKRIIHLIITTLVMSLCSILAVYNIMNGEQPYPYAVAVFSIASLILFKQNERFFAYGIAYLFFIIVMIIHLKGNIYELEGVLFHTFLTCIAYIVSFIKYDSKVKNFINKKIIIENSEMLKNMNRIVQESLERRTQELNEIIEYEKLRTDFFANISHELRTPLTIISSAQQMLSHIFRDTATKYKPIEINQYIHMMGQNCDRLLRLISNLIDITKIDAGYFNVNLENHDIVSIIENITLSTAKYIEDTNIKLTFDTEMEEKVVACDPDKIERIMLNLLSNAVKFTPKRGNIFVNIFNNDDKVVISVKDTGIGVPPEMKDLIFEKFVQVNESTESVNRGSGIGLSIVKSLVEMHNGNVYLVSDQGIGSEFIFEIPNRTVIGTKAVNKYDFVEEDQISERIKIELSDLSL